VPTALLETKLFVPRPRRGLVPRPRLSERLNQVTASKLMLVSAPAGFGKTTLLAEWLAARSAAPTDERQVAWLSLDPRDNDPAVFWPYFVAALQTAAPGVGVRALALLQPARPAAIEVVLTELLNDLDALPSDVILVLDDYHVIDGQEVQAAMAFLLDHLPSKLHLVIGSRADPALPLARLRARGELVEIRAAELRFTLDEAAAYLTESMGLVLTAPDVAALERRTEGWIAALQLAALSMQGRDNVAGFIAGFAGDDRYIVDYLVDEVLDRQSEGVRDFLVQTSILDRLSGPLCDAVTGRDGGTAMLKMLDRANLFVVPLDDSRRWYRYHHLFADVLQTHLLAEGAEAAGDLHRRASQWYGQHAEPSPAIRHALAAGDVDRAADLIELAVPELRRNRQDATIRGWLDVMPDAVVHVRPVLAIGLIGALMAMNEFDAVEPRLNDLERCLEPIGDMAGTWTRPAGMVVVDEPEFLRLPAAVELYRAALALIRGDASGTISHAQLAMERTIEGDHVIRAGASALSALAFWGQGDLEAALRGYSICVDGLQRSGHISDVLGASIAMADIRITQGRLSEAARTFEQRLQLAAAEAGPAIRGTADMHVGLSRIAYERDDLNSAAQHLERARELGEHTWLPQNPYRWRVAMARLREADGDLDGALQLLDEAQRVYVGDFSPNVRPVSAMRARVLAAQGRLTDALAWAREHSVSADDELSYLREFEHITLARVLLAQSRAGGAEQAAADVAQLTDRLLRAAEAGERAGSVIEVLVLQALTRQADGDIPTALTSLERALILAEPEGYVRVFVGEGPPMASLLTKVAKQGATSDYVRRLLGACRRPAGRPAGAPTGGTGQRLVEPLSDRELDVLRLLGSDLDGPVIARELSISLNTLRTHTKSIYAKLGVTSRRAAVSKGAELNVL
jgi:LuxR family maltose regulon positive regulatory protein